MVYGILWRLDTASKISSKLKGKATLLERIKEANSVVECVDEIINILFSVVKIEAGTCTCIDS
jgi:peptidyl-tRNA hydrolase